MAIQEREITVAIVADTDAFEAAMDRIEERLNTVSDQAARFRRSARSLEHLTWRWFAAGAVIGGTVGVGVGGLVL